MAHYLYHGLKVPDTKPVADRELYFISKGGRWKNTKNGEWIGMGMEYHFLKAISAIWPHIAQHRWFRLFVHEWLHHDYVGVMGPKSSGKTLAAAVCHLVWYYAHSSHCTVIVCSDTTENLEDRIWGEIKKLHLMAKARFHWIPGNLIEGRKRIVTDSRDSETEGRDFRNGLVGIPVKKGNQYVGISAFVGRKNKYVFLCGDELSLIPKSFVDAIASLTANQHFKITGMGNPSQTTDALGIFCEPAPELGGWDSGIDQSPKTKTWKTRMPKGICIQLPGEDCPNMDVKEGEPIPFPYLITRQRMDEDAKIWGREDWHYTMFNSGRMPRGQGTNRIITKQVCIRHGAMEQPVWLNANFTDITALDAAFRAVGGDRCVLMRLRFGPESVPIVGKSGEFNLLLNQQDESPTRKIIIAVMDTVIVPIADSNFTDPEDQIVMFVKQKHALWNIPPENHFFDAGMKSSLVTAYGRLWTPKVNTVDFGGRPSERKVSADIDVKCCDYYSKFVTELWYSARLAIEAGQVRGMSEELVLEGCQREWKLAGANKIEAESKKDMKTKTGRSPDLFDTFVIGLEGARQKGFVIRRIPDESQEATDHRWKRDLREKAREIESAHSLNYSA